ncbi:outer membrane beta-barrel protein [Qipengyuania sp. YG27]|uniref:Outer membrane beta-barrel protein n=1 Tax=Qipengyuania mesophila TaxID=2867246 RepID=A0ABS7JR13_9SPHN|nr:outer membrane beta-barrel protein [Qipengyuania mesophila]MBX7500058.1 outer membrane beta-barrel protein [Qipengyuania mesophila]
MNKISTLLVAGSMVAFAAPAMAQDADSNFDGFRVQGVTGYDALQAGSSVDDDGVDNNDQSIDGVVYGVQAGYDFDLGGAVVGLEAELSDSTAKTEYTNGDFEGFGFGQVDAGRDLFLGARVGAKVAPDLLLYAKGGYTNAKLNILSNDGTTEYDQTFDLDGWRAGAGVEYAINPSTFMNVEYRYSNYSKGEVDLNGDLADGDRFDVDLDRHQIMAGVGVRF